MSNRKKLAWRAAPLTTVALLGLLTLGRCSDDDGGVAPDSSVPDRPDAAEVDMVTSATPGVGDVSLAEGHDGWQQADCASCHPDVHRSGYGPADCATCHGVNGAPVRAAGHDDVGCAGCHPTSHAAASFSAPKDCRSCHRYAAAPDGCARTESHAVVVIGAGGGGLAAAATLALAGVDVVLLEKHYKVGGCMVSFQRGPYTIEASLHGFDALDEGQSNVALFESLDIYQRVVPVRVDPLYEVRFPERDYLVPADAELYRSQLKADFPHESDGIDALFDEMYYLHGVLAAAMQFQATGTLPEGVTIDDLMHLQGTMGITVSEFLAPFIADDELIALFTMLSGFAGTRPSELTALFFIAIWNSYHLSGYYYFEGGSQSIADAMADSIRDHGGRIELGALATRIVVEGGRATQVRTADGRCFDAEHVISNAPAPLTLFELVGREHLPADYVAEVEAMQVGASTLVLYLGVDRDFGPDFGESHELMVATGTDTDASYDASLACRPEDVGMAIVNYSKLDPTAAPAGRNVITLTTLLPYGCFDEWGWNTSREAYKQQKQRVADVLLQRAEQLLPGLTEHIEVLEIGTPQTIRGFTLNDRGTIFGWDNLPEQSFDQRLPQQTPIANLQLAGAWTYPGGGQSAVMISGQTAANAVLEALQTASR